MKIGDLVRHKRRGRLGIVLFYHSQKYKDFTRFFAKVHWLDGTKPLWVREQKLEVLNEGG